MNRFFIFFIFYTIQLVFPKNIQIIPYDWVGQFGLYKDDGTLLFNTDWKSNKLLFDGLFLGYPIMYGENVEKNFQKQLKPNFIKNSFDSSITSSEIKYKQGDFSLDQFSFHLDGNQKNRSFDLIAFKRSYFGNQNQYFHNSLQPIQQSYIATISSKKEKSLGTVSIGHFNTYSGFPDIDDERYLSSRITNSNTHFQHSGGKFNYIFSIDNFLQRFKSNHSLSLTSSTRYLTRNTIQGKVETYSNSDKEYSIGFILNNRSLQIESIFNQYWNSYYILAANKNLRAYLDFGSIGEIYVYNFAFDLENSFKNFDFEASFKEENKPIHAYYYFNKSDGNIQLIEKNRFKSFTMKWRSTHNYFSSKISLIKEINPIWLDNEKTQTFFFEYNNKFLPFLEFSLLYNKEKYVTHKTGGLGDWVGVDLKSNFSVFSAYMDISLNVNAKHFSERVSKIYFNPIESIPIFTNENERYKEMNILNSAIRLKVSSFVIEYNWINILEFFNYYKELSKVRFNPEMPLNGWQKTITFEWHFID